MPPVAAVNGVVRDVGAVVATAATGGPVGDRVVESRKAAEVRQAG